MLRSGSEAIRTQIQPSKPKREITNVTISQNTKRTYGQPSEQLFPKRWPLSNRNRAKYNMNTHKVKRHRNSDTKTGNREPEQNYHLGMVSNELLGGLNMFDGANFALNIRSGSLLHILHKKRADFQRGTFSLRRNIETTLTRLSSL